MFNVTRTNNHLDIDFSGKLDRDAMRVALAEFTGKSAGIENGTMLYRIRDFHLPTPAAIAVEFARMPGMLGLMKRFRRCAVLADPAWIRTVSEWEGRFLPHLEIRGFPPDEESEAQAWLEESTIPEPQA